MEGGKTFICLFFLTVLVLLPRTALSGRGNDVHQERTDSSTRDDPKGITGPSPRPITVPIKRDSAQGVPVSAVAEKQPSKQKWYERPLITDWGILIITLVYTIAALGLLHVTNAALVETKKAASAAMESADMAKRGFYLTHRPWVLVSNFQIETERTGGWGSDSRLVVTCRIYNVGDVPAIIRGIDSVLHVGAVLPNNPGFAAVRRVSFVLEPNGRAEEGYIYRHYPDVSPRQWDAIAAGQSLFVLGNLLSQGPIEAPEGESLFRTYFGAQYTGENPLFSTPLQILDRPVPMTVVTDPRYNRVE